MSKDNIIPIANPEINPEERSAMEADAEKAKAAEDDAGKFTYAFKKPFEYMGKTYSELTFDFASLNGQDCLDIGAELSGKGVAVAAPEFSAEYQRIFAARACQERLPADALLLMPANAFMKIVRSARTFLLLAE